MGTWARVAVALSRYTVHSLDFNRTMEGVASISHEFVKYDGYISRGGDLLRVTMTVNEAKAKYKTLQGCKGFCHRGGPVTEPIEIVFMDKWDNFTSENRPTSLTHTSLTDDFLGQRTLCAGRGLCKSRFPALHPGKLGMSVSNWVGEVPDAPRRAPQ